MSDKKDTSESSDTAGPTDSGDYEDDFEKDLEWLINEEEKEISSDTQNHDENEDVDKDLECREDRINSSKESLEGDEVGGCPSPEPPEPEEVLKDENSQNEIYSILEFNTKQLEQTSEQVSDSDSEGSCQESKLEDQDDDDEDIKRYILEKIEEANKLLLCQEPLDETKERKLKFKDDLVDLEVPSLKAIETEKNNPHRNISGRLSQLHICNGAGKEDISLSINGGTEDEHKDGKILVERDGKFELLSIHDIESQGFFPPLSVSFSDIEAQHISPKTSYTTALGPLCLTKEECLGPTSVRVPQPPPIRPCSAINITRNTERGKSPRRVQSANVSLGARSSTYCLSPRQKELQKQMEQRKEKIKKEEEIRKRIQEEEKRRENDMVFKAWLQKKKGQLQEERRIQRAKQMEDLNSRESRNPEAAYRSWLRKKQLEHMKEKQIQNLKEQEECMFFVPRTAENDNAYKQWLKRKRRERREEQIAAKERARQLRQEARRAKQIENILCSISEPKSLRFTDQYS